MARGIYVKCSGDTTLTKNRREELPLPLGEGGGEGYASAREPLTGEQALTRAARGPRSAEGGLSSGEFARRNSQRERRCGVYAADADSQSKCGVCVCSSPYRMTFASARYAARRPTIVRRRAANSLIICSTTRSVFKV